MIKLIHKHQDGNIISPEKLALSRANKLYNNYCLSQGCRNQYTNDYVV